MGKINHHIMNHTTISNTKKYKVLAYFIVSKARADLRRIADGPATTKTPCYPIPRLVKAYGH